MLERKKIITIPAIRRFEEIITAPPDILEPEEMAERAERIYDLADNLARKGDWGLHRILDFSFARWVGFEVRLLDRTKTEEMSREALAEDLGKLYRRRRYERGDIELDFLPKK